MAASQSGSPPSTQEEADREAGFLREVISAQNYLFVPSCHALPSYNCLTCFYRFCNMTQHKQNIPLLFLSQIMNTVLTLVKRQKDMHWCRMVPSPGISK